MERSITLALGLVKGGNRWAFRCSSTQPPQTRPVRGIMRKRSHEMVLVVDDDLRLLGIVTSADLRHHDTSHQSTHSNSSVAAQ